VAMGRKGGSKKDKGKKGFQNLLSGNELSRK
jgi:hypothetical protein